MAEHAEIELNAAAGPGAARRDVAELYDVVAVDEIQTTLLVVRAPDFAADFGEYIH